jgi:type IV pilus biogenesis protein CpaD/CtpE
MRVFYRSVRRAVVVYQQTRAVFCCAEMKRHWDQLIGFGARGVNACTSREVNLFLDRPQAHGRSVLELVPIQCCPFCGEVIETVREK